MDNRKRVVGLKRIWRLADFLSFVVPDERVCMQHWTSDIVGDGEYVSSRVGPSIHRCGTAACAVGWASTIPVFRRAGLRFDGESFAPSFPGDPVSHGWAWSTRFGDWLGITETEFGNLFFSGDAMRRSKAEQVAYMRQFVTEELAKLPRKSKWTPTVGEYYGPKDKVAA